MLNENEAQAYLSGHSSGSSVVNMLGGSPAQEQVINFTTKTATSKQQTANNSGMGNMSIDVLLNELDKGLAQRITQGRAKVRARMIPA